tara:strand:+ start:4359 stop:5456 length:1098 start_codon:yes stop_codon:yes gene_type:complete
MREKFYIIIEKIAEIISRNIIFNPINSFKSRICRIIFGISWRLIFIKKKNYSHKKNKINLFFWPVWGKEYLDNFFLYSLPSLLSENNLQWISKNYECELDLYFCDDVEELRKKYESLNLIPNSIKVNFHNLEIDKNKSNYNKTQIDIYIDHIKKCLEKNSMSMTLTADMIYSEDSLKNLILLSDGKNYCYGCSHARVLNNSKVKNSLNLYKKNGVIDINHKKLVKIAFDNLSKTYTMMNDQLDNNISHKSLSWRHVGEDKIAIVASLVHPFFCNFEISDLDMYSNLSKFAEIDRLIPQFLFQQSRLKIIPSSSIFFAIELTHEKDETLKSKDLLPIKNNDQPINITSPYIHMLNSIPQIWEFDKD